MAKTRINPAKFAQEIMAIQEILSLTNQKLSDKSNIKLKEVEKIVKGKAKIKKKHCKKIGKALQVPPVIVKLMGVEPTETTYGEVLVETQNLVKGLLEVRVQKKKKIKT